MPAFLPAAVALGVLLLVFWPTMQSMIAVWSRSETFTHAFLVVPISAWLIWRRRETFAVLPWRAVPWLVVPMAALGLLWLLGELAAVSAASQFAFVGMLVLLVPALFGWRIARAHAFALGFLFFMVPFGEFAVPQLMTWTADFTAWALRAVGIPVYREGLQFVIPSGAWSVVEACSGVRYLIASTMVGTLFAYLNYRSTRKRLVFIAFSMLVPLLANWVRAFLIVLLGHLSGNELAAGADHLIYGWLFFGLVIGAMFFVGARWSDPEADAPVQDAPSSPFVAVRGLAESWLAVAMIGVMALLVAGWLGHLERRSGDDAPLPGLPLGGDAWRRQADGALPWTSGFVDPDAAAGAVYTAATAPTVWMWMGHYRQPGGRGKLVSSVNDIVSANDKSWSIYEREVKRLGDATAWRASSMRRGGALEGTTAGRLRVWQAYRLGDAWLIGDAKVKLAQATRRLVGGRGDGSVIMLATLHDARADETLERFWRVHAADFELAGREKQVRP